MIIPSNNTWTQFNEGNVFGALHRTRNINLNKRNQIKLGQKSQTIFDDTSVNLGYVKSIVFFDGSYVAVGTDSSSVIYFDLEGNVAGATGAEPTLSIYGDALVYGSALWITTATATYTYNGTTYTDRSVSLTNNVPHPMAIFDSLPTYKVAIGNGSSVKVVSGAYAEGTALTLPSKYVVSSLAYNNGYLYIGTYNQNGGDAAVFVWDGNSANANSLIPVSGNYVYSVKPYKNSVAVITSSGELLYVSGAGSQRLGALPIFYEQNIVWQVGLNSGDQRIYHRGMETDGDDIYLNVNANIDNDLSSDYLPGFETGIWQFTPETGLNHFASSVLELPVSDTGLSVASSVITTSAAHNLKTGDAVVFSAISGLSGVSTGIKYYVTVLSTTTIKLSTSRRSLQDESYLTITGTADSGDVLEYTPNTEYHQYARVSSGAISKLAPNDTNFKHWATPIVWGASIQNTAIAARRYGVCSLIDSYNVGFAETQRIYSDNISEIWKGLAVFLDELHLDNEEIIVKYRLENEHGYPTSPFLGQWNGTSQIDSVSSVDDEFDWSYIEAGDEVMVIDGAGRGKSAHVSSTNLNGTTYEITIDEAIGTDSVACRVSFTNYRKINPSITNSRVNLERFIVALGAVKSNWIQFKFELRGYGTTINRLFLSNSPDEQGK